MSRPEDFLKMALAMDRHKAAKHSSSHSGPAYVVYQPMVDPTDAVLAALLARGCVIASAPTPAPTPRRDSCRVRGCRESHSKHFCKGCGNSDSSHFSGDCPSVTSAVPPELARRGIVAVTATPRSTSSSAASCGVPGCSVRHPSHYCNVCDNWGVSHNDYDCPRYKKRDYTSF
jgi:hypothetical protein